MIFFRLMLQIMHSARMRRRAPILLSLKVKMQRCVLAIKLFALAQSQFAQSHKNVEGNIWDSQLPDHDR